MINTKYIRACILLGLSLLSINVIGQIDNLNFVNTQNKWYQLQSFQGQPAEYQTQFFNGDTIIDGKEYLRLFESKNMEGVDAYAIGLYREEDGKIFTHQGTEILYFDTNLLEGDDIVINWDTLTISTIETIELLDGSLRKQFSINCNNEHERTYIFLQGVGYLQSFSDNCIGLIDTPLSLTCFEQDESIIFINDDSNLCWVNSTQDLTSILLEVYPNPATSHITITADNSRNVTILITDLLGNQVLKTKGTKDIDISDLPAGTYYIISNEITGFHQYGMFVKM